MEHVRISEVAKIYNTISDKGANQTKLNSRKTCLKCGSLLDNKGKCPKCDGKYIFENVFANSLKNN